VCLFTAERIGRLLERFGLSASCLSQSGTLSLKTLVDVCMTLGVQQASDSEYVFSSILCISCLKLCVQYRSVVIDFSELHL